MKKTIFVVCLMILSFGASSAFASVPENKNPDNALPGKTENKLSEEELSRLTRRVEEIRDMDKSDMSAREKRELRKEVREIKESVKKEGGYLYIGAGTILVILLIVLLLL